MLIEIKMPQLGQTSDEVKLIKWLVSEGQEVKKGQALCEVETDKVTMEMESLESGKILKLVISPESIVRTGEVIAILGDSNDVLNEKNIEEIKINEKINSKETSEIKNDKIIEEVKSPKINELKPENINNIKATNLVKNIAKIKNIDLSKVKGTGPSGLITKEDLENYQKMMSETSNEVLLSQNQLSVAINLLKSKTEIPHYYLKREINADKFLKSKEFINNTEGSSISMYSFLIFATAQALKQMPKLNGYFKDNKVILRNDINIGFALSVGDELYVPVIKNADAKTIPVIDKELKSLALKAKSNDLEFNDISGGTFTITNLGMFGVDEFSAIINLSQAGIFSIGKLRKTLFIDENERMSIKNVFTLTASFDHRFINGKLGAEFIEIFRRIFEEELPLE
jgi:pyruvate dehydrogenase E2 component (dihydrolipoamide acetyltransferase)